MSTQITVRVSNEEKNLAEKLAIYLHKRGNIDEPTISNAIRMCIRFTVGTLLKTIEAERYTR